MALPQRQPEPPFRVVMAGYVIDFHHRNVCSKCEDNGCPRINDARKTLEAWRDRKPRREGR
ncbi:hypothetical protein [Micromonospora haikouensis]|uniref:hypothetical protein n=1 Tax=Micromonospora haikouensis TaxID=686309 RepID=UPI0037A61B03